MHCNFEIICSEINKTYSKKKTFYEILFLDIYRYIVSSVILWKTYIALVHDDFFNIHRWFFSPYLSKLQAHLNESLWTIPPSELDSNTSSVHVYELMFDLHIVIPVTLWSNW